MTTEQTSSAHAAADATDAKAGLVAKSLEAGAGTLPLLTDDVLREMLLY